MSKNKVTFTHIMKIVFLCGLVVMVNFAYVTSFFVMFGSQMEDVQSGVNNYDAYVALMPIISFSSFVLADFLQMARFFRKKNVEVVADSLKFSFIQTLITLSAKDLTEQRAFPRSVILISFLVLIIYIFTWQMICMAISKRVYETGSLVIIGSNIATMNQVKAKISPSLKSVDLDFSRLVRYSDKRAVKAVIRSNVEIFLCPDVPEDVKSDIILACAKYDTVVYVVPQFYEISLYKSRIIYLNDLMVMLMDRMGLTFEQRLFKRTLDIIVSIIALVISAPVLLICALLIKAEDGGPVFFKQERLTINNKPYFIYKLRTMRVDAETATGAVISGKNDPRVTRIGRFLRRSKIDEIPQFLNVLMGEMSVVGPRSERPEFVATFEKKIPGYSQRFAVKAGITGLAQIAGNYDTTAADKLRYDLLYIKNYSILQDIKIIFLTVRAVFTPHLYNQSFEENRETVVSTDSTIVTPIEAPAAPGAPVSPIASSEDHG